jgi:large subunit ribosomal protein L4
MKVQSLTASGQVGSTTVNDQLFGVTPNLHLIAQAIRVYRANERQGTSATKTRSMVNRTSKKWFKQKGTGNARHGARNAPLFVGGGVAHGPKAIQNWSLKLTKQMKKVAMKSALSAQAPQLFVADEIESLSGKTKQAASLLAGGQLTDKRVLVVLSEMADNVVRSLRNLDNVLTVSATQVSILEVAMADAIIISTKAIGVLESRLLASEKEAKKTPKAESAAKTEVAKKATPAKTVKKEAAPKTTKKVTKKS